MTTGKNPDQHQGISRNTGNIANARQQVNWFPYQDYRYDENRGGHQQTSVDERHSRHYSPIYNNYQPTPLGSIPGQGLSATLIDLAKIQSRSLEIMVANQKSQQEVFNELARSNMDKANEAMFSAIKVYNGTNRGLFKEWIDELD